MYFQLFMHGIWIAYVTSNKYKIEYATDYERAQENYVISFHDYRREKRQVENSWSPSTTAHTNLTIIPTTQTYNNATTPTTQIHSNVTRPTTQIHSNVTRPTTQIHSNVTRPATQIHSNVTRPATQIHSNVSRPATQIHSNVTRPTTQIYSNVTRPTTHINGNVTNRPTTKIQSNVTRPTTHINGNMTTRPTTHINGNMSTRPTTHINGNVTTRPTTHINGNMTTRPTTHINGNMTTRPTTQINGTMTTKPTTKISSTLPSTTNTPNTTRLPTTTKAPSTTREAISTTTTTISKETTFNPPETTYIKQSNTYQYYNSTVIHDGNGVYWDELENHTTHVVLSDAKYLSSAGLNLPFTMPFYGHNISKVQLTTGGFIYMAPFVHKFLTYSQYVAPLMANFDTQTDNSDILYKKYNDSVVIEWRNVHLNDQRYHGQFRFQAKLFQNGSIMLVYKTIPAPVMNISTDNHPVKLGISDAFYMDYTQNGIRYRRIYKYHAVNIEKSLITNNTVVIFHPLPTCNLATSCDHCVSRDIDFDCSWCPSVRRCSNGYDWYRQEWSESVCWEKAGNTTDTCKATTVASTTKLTTQSTTTTIPTKPPITTRTPSTSTPPTTTTTTPPSTSSPPTATTTIPTTSTITPSTSTTLSSTTQSTKTPTTTTPTTTKSTTTPATTISTTTPTTTKSTTTPTTTTPTTTPTTTVSSTTISSPNQPNVERHTQRKESYNKAAVIVPIVLFLLLIVGLIGSWVYYAYTHPNTSAGQWLIEHRPSQLKSRFSDMFKRSTETGEKYKVKNEDIEFDMDESVA
ncbi:Plexin domain-containing protein 2,Plexin domain-containing protein 1 [Mytilus coruscus]|uniref:Plexin domain-containing protein 2,Plexin domain-containing protein 1 n=1 Tax=Mytilus coruscus TaxID=42192 RepID=A0A6J8CEX1_MYTCO|nr:Plexin domain-containing protein 2,Plexin domain-containing protein 1 [Mytilus coruscus]